MSDSGSERGPFVRALARDELPLLWTIDRSERVEQVYRVTDGALVLQPEHHDLRGWPEGEPEHYAPILADCFDHGGSFWGAFAGDALVGAAVLESRFISRRSDTLQLKFLHVGRDQRGTGLGKLLFHVAEARARELGAARLYVSATTSQRTIEFYLHHGFALAEEIDPDLFALEPEDIHLSRPLPSGR